MSPSAPLDCTHPFIGLTAGGLDASSLEPVRVSGTIVAYNGAVATLLDDDGDLVHAIRVKLDDPGEARARLRALARSSPWRSSMPPTLPRRSDCPLFFENPHLRSGLSHSVYILYFEPTHEVFCEIGGSLCDSDGGIPLRVLPYDPIYLGITDPPAQPQG